MKTTFSFILVIGLAHLSGVFSEEHSICQLVEDHEEAFEKIIKCHTNNIPGEFLNRVYLCAETEFPVTDFHDFFTEGCEGKITDMKDQCLEDFEKYIVDNNVKQEYEDGVTRANQCLRDLASTYNIQELEELF